jgi:hypothetical protein
MRTTFAAGNTAARKHGLSSSLTYTSWRLMKQRCLDKNNPLYQDYGGRGIKVHGPWIDSFEQFVADVGERPGSAYTLERKKNDGHYEPGNVCWATRKQQARNRRSSRRLTANGVTLTLVEWCEKLGCNRSSITRRLARGMSEQDALTVPMRA